MENFLVEPLPGYGDEVVEQTLREAGITDIEIVAPGFISVNAPLDQLSAALSGIAIFAIKPTHQPRA